MRQARLLALLVASLPLVALADDGGQPSAEQVRERWSARLEGRLVSVRPRPTRPLAPTHAVGRRLKVHVHDRLLARWPLRSAVAVMLRSTVAMPPAM